MSQPHGKEKVAPWSSPEFQPDGVEKHDNLQNTGWLRFVVLINKKLVESWFCIRFKRYCIYRMSEFLYRRLCISKGRCLNIPRKFLIILLLSSFICF